MAAIPPACGTLDAEVSRLQREVSDLEDELAGQNQPPNEPAPSPSEKEAIGQQLNGARADLRKAVRRLDDCIRANTPPPPPDTTPNLEITSIMVTQSIQTLDNRIRLIRNRPTAVRVFIVSGLDNGFETSAGRDRWPNVTGDLRVSDPDTGFSSGPIQPFNLGGAITAVPARELSVDSLSHSVNFRLPRSTISARRLDLTARAWVSGHISDPGGWTTQATTSVELGDRRAQEVTPLLITDAWTGTPAPSFATYTSVLRRGSLARLPVPFFTVNAPISLATFNDLTGVLGWANMMAGLITTIAYVGRSSGGIRTGIVPLNAAYAVGGMGVPRIGFTPPVFVSWPTEDLFAHEMGHTHGLNHAVCSGTEPWPHDDRLPGHTDETGVHVEDGTVIRRGSPELMGYCAAPTWPSRATYDHVYDNPA